VATMNPRIVVVLLCCLLPAGALSTGVAEERDRDQPIRIEADRVQIDDIKGVSVYSGNVIYTQGTIRLEADTVRVYHDEQRKLVRLEAFGEPARFRQRLEGDDEDMLASALRMEYFASPERLVLEREAWVWRENVEFTGEFISYDAEDEIISAVKGEDDAARVHIVIQPRTEPDQPPSGTLDIR
jgi:lipopolysaccharide export system protein LptA